MRMLNCFSGKATVVDPLPFIVKALCELRDRFLLLLLIFLALRGRRVRELVQESQKLLSD
jgi:hypothetical protein